MLNFFIDLTLLAIFVIGLTAFLGIITHGAAAKLFGKNTYLKFETKSKEIQSGWRKV
jgi:cytochrome b561